MSDDPNGPDDLRGGKKLGDPALEGAPEQGRGHKKVSDVQQDAQLLGDRPARGSVAKP